MSEKLTLRPYQSEGLKQIQEHYASGVKKVLLHLATGGGKTLMFCRVLEGVHKKNKHAIMVVKGIELVENASQRLFREGIPHGVMQGYHWNNRPNERIQVCSIDTLRRRKKHPNADLIIFDEAHYAVSPSYKWLIEKYPDAYYLPVTATPHVKKGLKHIAEKVVYPISINDLISQGYLSKPRYFSPSSIDVSGVKTDSTGDFNNKDLFDAANHSGIYGDIVSSYKKFLIDKPAVCFAVNIDHSKRIKESFLNAGISCEHIEANTPQNKRHEVLKKLETGEIKVVTNVGILLVGVDIPCLRGVIMARPTKSYNLYIQAVGRGTRLYKDKKDFLVLDHAGNVARHGMIEDERECILEGWQGKKKNNDSIIVCEVCFSNFSPAQIYKDEIENLSDEYEIVPLFGRKVFMSKMIYICPNCSYDNSPKGKEIIRNSEAVQGDLKELTKEEKFDLKVKAKIKEFEIKQKAKGYKKGWIYHKIKTEFGEDVAKKYYKRRKVPDWVRFK